ncbi:Arylsulfatase A [Pricia antarctica]|uniref:Arylsulfatase A n=1 Tax=Pricia antarctica TaxID=641691 RepID=A0A1G7F9F3_9FLAO|nr:Arylsulfatase A [Pricia antarctica]
MNNFAFTHICLLFACTILAQEKSNRLSQSKPNIIWLMAEDMSLDLECYGMKAVKTPNLNKMAEEGIRFDNCFVTNPICSPSRSAMLTGTHQVKINAHNHRSNRDVPLDENFKPFTYWLRKAGYTTILGHHGVMGKGRKIDVNFKHEPLGPWDGKTQFGIFDKYDTFEKGDQPFFAQIQLVASHRGDWWNEVREQSKHPVDPNEVELPKFMANDPIIRLDWAKYLDQIEYLDNEVGMIFQELKDKGMADNTIVIFIGDNGRCNIRGKGYLQDPGLHIPLIVYSPKGLDGDRIRKDVVSATDITATILDFAGIEVPEYMTGKPIFDKNFKRDYVYGARDLWDEIEEKSRAVTSGKWAYIRNDRPEVPFDAHQAYLEFYRPAVHVMRRLKKEGKLNDAQKIFFEPTKPKEELYDLEKDPQELHNLAENPEYGDILDKLRKRTLEYDIEMKPGSTIYHPVHAISVDVLEWVKKERPEQYQQMLDGVEIGFHPMTEQYKKSK